jgi:hypothetical protein
MAQQAEGAVRVGDENVRGQSGGLRRRGILLGKDYLIRDGRPTPLE